MEHSTSTSKIEPIDDIHAFELFILKLWRWIKNAKRIARLGA
jgi:hypothetical protein